MTKLMKGTSSMSKFALGMKHLAQVRPTVFTCAQFLHSPPFLDCAQFLLSASSSILIIIIYNFVPILHDFSTVHNFLYVILPHLTNLSFDLLRAL